MARGKKKGNKTEGEEKPSQQASVSEEQPSTSAQEPVEEDDGLGLGLGRKKKQKPKAVQQETAVAMKEATPPSDPVVKAVEETTEEFQGLGLDGGKKRNRRKKTGAAGDGQPQAQAAPGNQPAGHVQPQPPQQQYSQPAPGAWPGAQPVARGWPGSQPAAPPGHGAVPQPGVMPGAQTVPQPGARPGQQVAPVAGWPGSRPAAPPGHGAVPQPGVIPGAQTVPQPGAWPGQQAAPVAGWPGSRPAAPPGHGAVPQPGVIPGAQTVPQPGAWPGQQAAPVAGWPGSGPAAPPGHGAVPQPGVIPGAQTVPQAGAGPGQQVAPVAGWPGSRPAAPPGHGTVPQPGVIPGAQTVPQPGAWPGQQAAPVAGWPGSQAAAPPGHGAFPPQSQPGAMPGAQTVGQPGAWPGQQAVPVGGRPGGPPGPQPGAGRGRSAGRGQPGGRGQRPGEQFPSQPTPVPQTQLQPVQAQPSRQQQYSSQQGVVCRFKIPHKIPGGMVRSRNITVLTNYLRMNIEPLKITRYDLSFKPDKPKKMIPQVFKLLKDKHFPKELIAFDQMKNCYALKPLPIALQNERFTTNLEIKDQNGKVMKFEVTIKPTGIVDLAKILSYMSTGGTSLSPPTEEIQCIDVILRQGTLESYVKAGRQFFKRPNNPIDLGCGLEMWTGLFQSAIFTSSGFVNVDVAHKGFPRNQTMIDAITRDFRMDPSKPLERQRGFENFEEFIKGLRVVAHLVGNTASSGQKRDFICNGVVDPPARLTFTMTDAAGTQKRITVADYFAKEKNYRLKYPNLNCMWVGPRDKNIYFPIELLDVAYGQALNKQLNDMQLSKMVREAATKPDERMRKIYEIIGSVNYSKNEQFRKFGLEIPNQFTEVGAKILAPPNLDIGEGPTVPKKGVWQANKLLKPEVLQSWGFIAIETANNIDYDNMITMLLRTGQSMGMTVARPALCNFNATMRDLRPILFTALEKGINFLFIIVSARGRDYYHKVKQMAECDVGILTQCVKENTAAMKMNPMTAKNILLKVNSKLMGINQVLSQSSLPRCLKDGGVMVVGADVTHPSPDQSSIPSIAAVTASIDPHCYKYNIELSIQTPKKEMIVEFEDMMVDHLKIYMKHNQNKLPRKIFVFRDGVSEGQFGQVMNSELQAVHNAYQRMTGTPNRPEVLFLLVQKRHHTRFFQPQNSQYNVEPGTVVDTHIVHASELDFYLVSHQAIKGTARPTRYHAVCNDGKIPDVEVEQLTYYLCHLFSRCMRAVSYPTPTYYAHLACLRARSLTHGQRFDNQELERKPKRLRVLDKMLQYSRMFFV